MRKRCVQIALVLGASLTAVYVETWVMALTSGMFTFGSWDNGHVGNYPLWPGGDNGLWPVEPRRSSSVRETFRDGKQYLAVNFGDLGSMHAGPEHQYYLGTFQVGWPFRCATYQTHSEAHLQASGGRTVKINQPPSLWQQGIDLPDWTGAKHPLPVQPLWPGLIGNTLLHALVLTSLLILSGWLLRTRRRAKGACLACGYSLAGIAPASACPECGAAC